MALSNNVSDKQSQKEAKETLKREENRRKEREKALKQFNWAFKTIGMAPEALIAVMHSGNQGHHLILTDSELIWVKKGMLGGKVESRIPRSSVVSFSRDSGWTSNNIVFQTTGPVLGKDNRFPDGDRADLPNMLEFLDQLSHGALTANTPEEIGNNIFRWLDHLQATVPQEAVQPPSQKTAAPQVLPQSEANQRPAESRPIVVAPEDYLRPFNVYVEGVDNSLKPDGEFGGIEFGAMTGAQAAARLSGLENPQNWHDEDLCRVHPRFERDGKEIWVTLAQTDQWEIDFPVVGIAEKFSTSEMAEILEKAMVALELYGLQS